MPDDDVKADLPPGTHRDRISEPTNILPSGHIRPALRAAKTSAPVNAEVVPGPPPDVVPGSTTVYWPALLPQAPLLEGYTEVAPNIVRRSSMDTGPPKVARRFTANVSKIACRYALTKAELVLLDDFFFGLAGGGSVPFYWPHPWKHVDVRVRFTEPPSYTNAGHPETAWIASLALEVLPPGMQTPI